MLVNIVPFGIVPSEALEVHTLEEFEAIMKRQFVPGTDEAIWFLIGENWLCMDEEFDLFARPDFIYPEEWTGFRHQVPGT